MRVTRKELGTHWESECETKGQALYHKYDWFLPIYEMRMETQMRYVKCALIARVCRLVNCVSVSYKFFLGLRLKSRAFTLRRHSLLHAVLNSQAGIELTKLLVRISIICHRPAAEWYVRYRDWLTSDPTNNSSVRTFCEYGPSSGNSRSWDS